MSCRCWEGLLAVFTYIRIDALRLAPRARPGSSQEEDAGQMADHDPSQRDHQESEPEGEPFHLTLEQEEHLRSAFPDFQVQTLQTSSDHAFAAWLQQGMTQ